MDAALSIFEELRKKDLDLINKWVAECYREDLHLDFKRKSKTLTPELDDNDKRNYSKALSGFANSDGGVIVWGIDAPGSGLATRAKFPIDNVVAFAEQLDSMASRLVVPQVDGVLNHVIFEDKLKATGYVVSVIPQSIAAPHRAEYHSYKRYYQRSGDSFIQLEHWQLEYMFGRRQVPDLKVAWTVIPSSRYLDDHIFPEGILKLKHDEGSSKDAVIRVCILNKGRAIAKYACLRLHYRSEHNRYRINKKYRHNLIDYSKPVRTYFKPGYHEITARARPGLVVYPNDRMPFFEFYFSCSEEELKNKKIPDFTVYYDLFAEHIRGVTAQKLTIPGDAISRILGNTE